MNMEILSGLISLVLAFGFMYVGGIQYALDRGDVARVLGAWAVGRTWYELKSAGVLMMAGGACLILPMIFGVPETVRTVGAAVLAGVALIALVGHLGRLQITRAAVDLVVADLSVAVAVTSAL